eukprot:458513-Amphidinium_carterae.1
MMGRLSVCLAKRDVQVASFCQTVLLAAQLSCDFDVTQDSREDAAGYLPDASPVLRVVVLQGLRVSAVGLSCSTRVGHLRLLGANGQKKNRQWNKSQRTGMA